jgi:hypothetical protein
MLAAAELAGSVAVAGDAAASAESAQKLATGRAPSSQLLLLMDTDKNGQVSKEEFMRFRAAEFDYADRY